MRTKVERRTSQATRNTPDPLERTLRQLWLADAADPAEAELALDDALGIQVRQRLAELRERLAGGRSVQAVRRLRKDLQAAREALQAATHRHERAEAALREALQDGATDKAAAARDKLGEAAAARAAAGAEVRLLSDLLDESAGLVREEGLQAIASLKETLLSEAQEARARALQRLRGMIQAKAFQAALREFNAAERLVALGTASQQHRPSLPLERIGMRWWSLDAALRELGGDRLCGGWPPRS